MLAAAQAQMEREQNHASPEQQKLEKRVRRWRGLALGLCAAAALVLIFRPTGPGNTGRGAGGGPVAEHATCPGFPAPREPDPPAPPADQASIATMRRLVNQEVHYNLATVQIDQSAYPTSPFRAEHEAFEIHLLLCGSPEEQAAARTKAQAFLTRTPAGPWADRARRDLASPPKAVPR